MYLEHPEKQLVLAKWNFLLDTFPDLASGQPIPDSMIEFGHLTAKRFQDLLSKLGAAVDRQESKRRKPSSRDAAREVKAPRKKPSKK